VFKVLPLWGLAIAFKDFTPYVKFWDAPWIGVKNFTDLFNSARFYNMLRNTLAISLINLFFYFPAPILLALFLNEIRHSAYKRLLQTTIYLPHFLSWVVITGLTFALFSIDIGLINKIIISSGGDAIRFLSTPRYFWWFLLGQNIWREIGWGSILFLAAISQIDPTMYEAAVIDGANRWQQMRLITFPSILPTIITLFIIRLGGILEVSFEQVLLMSNSYVMEVSEVFDTYSYNQGVMNGNYSIATTVGLVKGIAGLAMVFTSDRIIKKLGYAGIF
jgi:putative aldouronate transport system permease protein